MHMSQIKFQTKKTELKICIQQIYQQNKCVLILCIASVIFVVLELIIEVYLRYNNTESFIELGTILNKKLTFHL